MNGLGIPGSRIPPAFFRDDRKGTAGAGESCGLLKTSELNRHFARAIDFVDRVRKAVIRDERFVCRIEQDQGLVLLRILDPFC